jgi:thioredoxin reductase (NADPH)
LGCEPHRAAVATTATVSVVMPLPLLLVIDEDPTSLEEVVTQLVQRYAHDYRIAGAGDPEEARRTLVELARGDGELALMLTTPSFTGTDGGGVLEWTRHLHPHAKCGLMVEWHALADAPLATAIGDAIALGRIDYYVPMPAGWPDEVFHDTIEGFLLEWATEQRKVPHTVHIVGQEWSGRAHELRETFQSCAAPHTFSLADSPEGRTLLSRIPADTKLPVMILPDGTAMGDPTNAEIAEAAGAPTSFEDRDFDVVIVGAGPAGLSAAVYGASEGLRTLVIDQRGIGGQAGSSSSIRNYLGFPRGVSGHRLAEQAHEQAVVFGASFVFMHEVTSLARADDRLELTLADGRDLRAAAVILATGASYRRLDVPSLEPFTGSGVFYGGPASLAHALAGTDVFVAGGGNSAGQAALHLARYARRVTILVRGETLDASMSHYLVQTIGVTPNIDVRARTTVVGGGGDGRLQELVLRDAALGADETVRADALFALIGADPHSDWLPAEIARDRHGFVYTGDDLTDEDAWPLERRPLALETSLPGVLAAGDVRHGSVKRVASAVGEGSIAVQLVHRLREAAQRPAVARLGG